MLNLKKLCFSYPGENFQLRQISAEITTGHVHGLLGKNGVGKSTLFNIMAGNLFPVSGKIDFFLHEPKHRRPDFLEQLFFLPENFEFPPLNRSDFLKYYVALYKSFSINKFKALCEKLEVPNNNRILNTMSQGERKKFLIAFGLATGAKLLLLDEPTNGLDISAQVSFRKLLVENKADDTIIIVSTHHIREFEDTIDSLLIMEAGELVLNSLLSPGVERNLEDIYTTALRDKNAALQMINQKEAVNV